MLHVSDDPIQLEIISHAMVKRFILPEGFSCSLQDEIG
jgi:hypothetical protein